MFRSLLRLLPIWAAVLYALYMSIWTSNSLRDTPGPLAAPDPAPYWAVGFLGLMLLGYLYSLEDRIRELERKLRERGGPAEPPAATSPTGSHP